MWRSNHVDYISLHPTVQSGFPEHHPQYLESTCLYQQGLKKLKGYLPSEQETYTAYYHSKMKGAKLVCRGEHRRGKKKGLSCFFNMCLIRPYIKLAKSPMTLEHLDSFWSVAIYASGRI